MCTSGLGYSCINMRTNAKGYATNLAQAKFIYAWTKRGEDVHFRKVHLHTLLKDDSIFRNGNFQIKNHDSII